MGPPIPRSGIREHAAWALVVLASTAGTPGASGEPGGDAVNGGGAATGTGIGVGIEPGLLRDLVGALCHVCLADRNRYAHAFAAEALARLAARGVTAAAEFLEIFLPGNGRCARRWKPPQMLMERRLEQRYADPESRMFLPGVQLGAL